MRIQMYIEIHEMGKIHSIATTCKSKVGVFPQISKLTVANLQVHSKKETSCLLLVWFEGAPYLSQDFYQRNICTEFQEILQHAVS